MDDESNESDNDSDKLNYPNKCAYCNFEAKNINGLKTHEKTFTGLNVNLVTLKRQRKCS